jgi:phosphoglycerol transferase MdoB-like AlkP superfamily enzyme
MLPAALFPLRLAFFWLLYYAVFRFGFIVWLSSHWSSEAPHLVWASFFYALPLDLSMTGYLLTLPLALWFVGIALGPKAYPVIEKTVLSINLLLLGLLILVFGSNIFLYEEWNTPVNNRALEYLATPGALWSSMSGVFIVVCVLLIIAMNWLLWRMYRKVVGAHIFAPRTSRWLLTGLPFSAALIFIMIRGGLGVMPINESAVYYSSNLFDDHSATNTAWHLIHSLIETRSTQNRYRVMNDQEAAARVEQLKRPVKEEKQDHSMPALPAGSRPNVVVIVMESMTAQVIEELGGERGACPSLSGLIRDGILFPNCYGSGYRTDQGIVSVLGGFPAQPDQSIILLSDKARKLNSLPKVLDGAGYSTLFCYGGELTFANIGVWLRDQHFKTVVSESDFPKDSVTQRWGVDDQKMLHRFGMELGKLKAPFFATTLTLSLHNPYDVPFHSKWDGATQHDKFLNSAAFADQAIGDFFKMAEKHPWFENTIFILVADHGNSMPGELSMDDPGSRHIPLILYGKPLGPASKGKRLWPYANHHDIPATLLALLGQPLDGFQWSRNLWEWSDQRWSGFSYYTNENGMGWADKNGISFYNFKSAQWHDWTGHVDSTSRVNAGAYLQTLYNDFLNY